MATYTHKDDLAPGIKSLTEAERRWIGKMDALLQQMPKRLLMLEHGDNLYVLDRAAARDVELHDGNAKKNGVVLAHFENGSFTVTGVSG